MNIRMAGLDWHVPIQLREQLSFPRGRVVELNRLIRDNPGVEGCALLSTCNRTERYLSCAEGTEPDPAGLNAMRGLTAGINAGRSGVISDLAM